MLPTFTQVRLLVLLVLPTAVREGLVDLLIVHSLAQVALRVAGWMEQPQFHLYQAQVHCVTVITMLLRQHQATQAPHQQSPHVETAHPNSTKHVHQQLVLQFKYGAMLNHVLVQVQPALHASWQLIFSCLTFMMGFGRYNQGHVQLLESEMCQATYQLKLRYQQLVSNLVVA